VAGDVDAAGEPHVPVTRDVVERALLRHAPRDVNEALRCFGGFEIVALVGALETALRRRRLVVLDGFITGVAALAALQRTPELESAFSQGQLLAGHVSAEAAHAGLLARLGLRPLFDLDLRLGEGSGAVLGISLVQSAARLMREMRTFREANLERPTDPRDA